MVNKQKHSNIEWGAWLIRLLPWLGGLLFALFAWYILVCRNSDYLFNVQERSLFLGTDVFYYENMAVPGGLIQWLGCYLTQFFYYPALGSGILIALWLLTYFVMIKAFRLRNEWSLLALVPLFALLSSETDLGYWLYYLKNHGYWFKESLGFFLMMCGVLCASRCHGWKYTVWVAAWTIIAYPLLGWYALFGSAIMAVSNMLAEGETKKMRVINLVAAIVLIAVVPLCWYQLYSQVRIEDVYTYGFPMFQFDIEYSFITVLPFYVLLVSSVVLAVLPRVGAGKGSHAMIIACINVVLVIAAMFISEAADFDNENYHAEMRMYNCIDKGEWDDALLEMRGIDGEPTRQMVLLKNIALINKGELGSTMFRYSNGGEKPFTRDSLHVYMVQTAASLIYFYHGKMNFATRWAIENGVEYGYCVDELRILAKCAIACGERELANKYISLLETTTFHKDEAAELRRFAANPQLMAKDEKYKNAIELYKYSNSRLSSDTGLCEIFLLNDLGSAMNGESRLMQDVIVTYALINKDIQLFWPRFFMYASSHTDMPMPIHYQEAAYLYGNLENQVDISGMPFDKEKIVDRYEDFNRIAQDYLRQGLDNEQVGQMMKPLFGDTFWWFYYFCTGIKSY